MPNLVVFNGTGGYKDAKANNNVINYIINKPYTRMIESGLLLSDNRDSQSMANQFFYVQQLRPTVKKQLIHFSLSLDDVLVGWSQCSEIMRLTTTYFAGLNLQTVCAYHDGSKKNPKHKHIHVVVNHISMDGRVFHGNYENYGAFLKYLNQTTNMKWLLHFQD